MNSANPDLLASLWTCVVLAMAASSISITITQTEIFAPLRALAAKLHPMIGHLAQCFYCLSHWIVILGIVVYRPVLISSGHLVVDLTVSVFFTITIASLMSGLIFAVFLAAMAKVLREREAKRILAGH